jgi:hypothetical protein
MGALRRRRWSVVVASLAISTLLACCNLNPQPLPPDALGSYESDSGGATVGQPGTGGASSGGSGNFGGGSSGSTTSNNDAGLELPGVDAAVPSEAGTDGSASVTEAGADSGTSDGAASEASITDGSINDAGATDGSAIDASADAAGDSVDQ